MLTAVISPRRVVLIAALVLSMFWHSGVIRGDEANRIQPYSENPFYWQHKGKPVLLRGASDEDNPFQWTGRQLTDHLDLLVSVGGNYLRNTMSDRDEGNVYAFQRVEDGQQRELDGVRMGGSLGPVPPPAGEGKGQDDPRHHHAHEAVGHGASRSDPAGTLFLPLWLRLRRNANAPRAARKKGALKPVQEAKRT